MKKIADIRMTFSGMIFTIAVIFGGAASHVGTAWADNGRHGHERQDNGWRGHERQAQQWHKQHIHHGRYEPRYGGRYEQEDPYVVYAPPMIVEPPQGMNIIIPLNFR